MRRAALVTLSLAIVVVVLGAVCLRSCEQLAGARIAIRSALQDEPDYDRLEADRAGRAGRTGRADEPAAPALPAAADAPAPYWTDYRGPGRRGEYDETPILTDWPDEGLALLWRQPVGAGYGSVTVAGGLVFSLEQRRDDEALVAYALETGAEVWIDAWPARFTEVMSGEGPRTTPVYAEGRVYALGAAGELRCVEAASGELHWRKDLLVESAGANLLYGLAATPLVLGDDLIVVAGAPEEHGATLLALDRASGEVRWRALDEHAGYASPLLARIGEHEQLLVSTGAHLAGLEARTGEVLWTFPWSVSQELTCAQPVVVDAGHVLLSGGYGKGAALVEVGASEHGWEASEVWSSLTMKNRFNSSVLFEGYVYGLDEGILACIDPLTGRRVWKGGRYGYGQLLLAQGHLLVVGEDGDLMLVQASPEGHRELHRFRALEGLTFNVPALAHGRLILRNKLEMACYELWAE